MDHITIPQIWAVLAAILTGVVLIGNAAEKIAKAWRTAKAPNERQDERLQALEEWRAEVDKKLLNDHERFEHIEKSSRMTQRALLALLDHGLDGNNVEQMKQAKDDLQSYLINR